MAVHHGGGEKNYFRDKPMIQDPDLDFYLSWIPDPGVKKAPDPGSASATLQF